MTRWWWKTSLVGLLAACGGGAGEGAGAGASAEEGPHGEAGHGGAGGHAEGGDHAGEGGHAEEVVLGPEARAAARIEVRAAVPSPLEEVIELPARIALDPTREAVVSSWLAGQVDAIRVRPGDTVRVGQELATVRSPEVGRAIGRFLAARGRHEAADARLERLRRLEEAGVASRAQVLDAEAEHAEAEGTLEAAEENLRILGLSGGDVEPDRGEHFTAHVPVRSPIAGKVLSTEVAVGRMVEPGDPLFHLGDLREVWLLVEVFEKDLRHVAPGSTVRFEVSAWPGEEFQGVVDQVMDWVDPDDRTVEVRVVVPNPDGRLKPNLFATARIATGEATRGIVIPEVAVQEIEGRRAVFVEEEPGRYAVRPVEIARSSGGRVLLASGVEAGERVVVAGAFALRSELARGELGEGHAH